MAKFTREVTEQDLRMPEFHGADINDLEFREDGKIVRKDRFQKSMRSIAYEVGLGRGRDSYECPDVVVKVKELVMQHEKHTKAGWVIQNAHGLYLIGDDGLEFVDNLSDAAFFDSKDEAENCITDNFKSIKDLSIKYAKAYTAFNVSDKAPAEVSDD